MCVVCGCETGAQPAPREPGQGHDHGHTQGHAHRSAQVPAPPAGGDLDDGAGPARVSVPGLSQARAIKLEADVLGENKRLAEHNRAHFAAHGVTAYNLMSSPGSGKTTLLCATIEALRTTAPQLPLAVIEGDQQTSNDAERIRASGASAIQVNTGKGCHLDAQMVGDAFARLDLHALGHEHAAGEPVHEPLHHPAEALLFIENVGNLVCPAMWDLGEAAKIVILSVTEGEDKPIKYPDMFAAARLMVLNKIDLLPHLDFDIPTCIEYARRVNPGIEVLLVSAKSGQGLDAWIEWLLHEGGEALAPAPTGANHAAATEAALRARIAELESRLAAAGVKA